MATASKIKLSTSHTPEFAVPNLTQESADKASELLQKNHDENHMFFNEEGFHNHIVHHILTIFALGASPSVLQEQYDRNACFQLPSKPQHVEIIHGMHEDEETFGQYLGTQDEFNDYLAFFQDEIEKKGWQDVVNEYLFCRSKRADDMLARCFGGFLHPLIHLGFGIEFAQPAIIAEGLAQTAVHDNWMGRFLFPAENLAVKNAGKPSKTLMELLHEGSKSSSLVKSIRMEDGNKIRDGVMKRAGQEMAELASQYTVNPDDLESSCAEMIEFCAYYCFAAQRPEKEVRVDFFLMHDFNSSIFFPRLLTHPSSTWLSKENKARLLEWKGRTDLAQYFARASPTLRIDEITNYKPKTSQPAAKGIRTNGHTNGHIEPDSWTSAIERIREIPDDGHASKLVRALVVGQQYCKGTVKNPTITDDMWLKMAQMAVDSVQDYERRFVRTTGFDSAWDDIPDRAPQALL